MVDAQNIPEELRALPQWVCWRYEERDGKRTKVPIRAAGGRASSTSPADWTTFETAVAASEHHDGIGFVFTRESGLVGIDLDHALTDSGQPEPWAAKIIDAFATYSEVSPSGRGVKMWVRATLAGERGTRRKYQTGEVEIYNWGRFFTVTGRSIHDPPLPIASQQRYVDLLLERITPLKTIPSPAVESGAKNHSEGRDLSDAAVIARLCAEKGGKGNRLFQGDITGYVSKSEADLALVTKIAWYVQGDAGRIDRIFGQSGLNREKWQERQDYRDATIKAATDTLAGRYYEGNGHQPPEHRDSKAAPIVLKKPGDTSGLFAMMDATAKGERRNVPWPWPVLSYSARALLPGSVCVLCGGAGSTKTFFMLEACLYWVEQGVPISTFFLEEDREFNLARALTQLAGNVKLLDDEWARDNPDEYLAEYERHRRTLEALSANIWDAPASQITLADVTDWVRDRATAGSRIIVVDPITNADPGDDQWTADRKFVDNTKRLMRDHNCSLVVVTHPRGAAAKGDRLDNIAGGRAYNRFTSSVLWLESSDDKIVKVRGQMGDATVKTNRVIQLWKTRNGPGCGMEIAYKFDPKTMRFAELGHVLDEKKSK